MIQKKYQKENAISLVALVVTIIVLLILAGVSINLIVGSNGILGKATKAADLTKFKAAEERVSLAVVASYGDLGSIEKDELKTNLSNIEGFETLKNSAGNEIVGSIQNADFPLTVEISGYEFIIEQTGLVSSNDENGINDSSSNQGSSSETVDTAEIVALKQQMSALQAKVAILDSEVSNVDTLKSDVENLQIVDENMQASITALSKSLAPINYISPSTVVGTSIENGGFFQVGNVVFVNMSLRVDKDLINLSDDILSRTIVSSGFPAPVGRGECFRCEVPDFTLNST